MHLSVLQTFLRVLLPEQISLSVNWKYSKLTLNLNFKSSFIDHGTFRLQNSRIFCERERRTIFERKVCSECKNGEGRMVRDAKNTRFTRQRGRVRLACFTLEDHAYGASRLSKTSETTVLQSIELFSLPNRAV